MCLFSNNFEHKIKQKLIKISTFCNFTLLFCWIAECAYRGCPSIPTCFHLPFLNWASTHVTIKYRGAIRNVPYKKHLRNLGDFDGGPYKKQFDVSLLGNFPKKVYLFHHFFKNFRKFLHNSPKGVMNFFYIVICG